MTRCRKHSTKSNQCLSGLHERSIPQLVSQHSVVAQESVVRTPMRDQLAGQVRGYDCVGGIGVGPNMTVSSVFKAVANPRPTVGAPVVMFHQAQIGIGTSQYVSRSV